MTGAPRIRTLSRESRLLILTITVAVIVLLVLARLRFPEPPSVAQAAVQPLERLAARAPYEDLAADIARVEAAVSPNVTVLRVRPRGTVNPVDATDVVFGDEGIGDRYVSALRVRPGLAVAAVGATQRVTDTIGPSGERNMLALADTDPLRGLATIRVMPVDSRLPSVQPLATLKTPAYVVAVEGTRAGLTLRPVFLGRMDRFESPRWSQPIVPLGSTPVSEGTLLFSLDGGFIGMAMAGDGAMAIVPAEAITDAVSRLAAGPPAAAATLGITVQSLTPALAQATHTATGVVVADVDPTGPSAAVLQPGDVITRLNGDVATLPDRLLMKVASRSPGETMQVIFVRAGGPHAAAVTLGPLVKSSPEDNAGFVAARERGVGSRVTHAGASSVFGRAGIHDADVIVRIADVSAPTPAQIRGAVDKAPPGSAILVVVRRGDTQRVLALQIPPK